MMKSDARADVLAENARLADNFINALFAVVYEVYGSSVCSCFSFGVCVGLRGYSEYNNIDLTS